MKPFRFRLDPVLGHRERIERERSGEHSRLLADQLAAEAVRDDLRTRRRDARARLTEEHATMDADTLRFTYAHLEYLDRSIVAAQQRADACAAATEQARLRLVAAARDRRVLETLRERRKESFLLEGARREQNELDDLNARSFDRAHLDESVSS